MWFKTIHTCDQQKLSYKKSRILPAFSTKLQNLSREAPGNAAETPEILIFADFRDAGLFVGSDLLRTRLTAAISARFTSTATADTSFKES